MADVKRCLYCIHEKVCRKKKDLGELAVKIETDPLSKSIPGVKINITCEDYLDFATPKFGQNDFYYTNTTRSSGWDGTSSYTSATNSNKTETPTLKNFQSSMEN